MAHSNKPSIMMVDVAQGSAGNIEGRLSSWPSATIRVGLFAALVVIGAPDWTRFLVAIPAIGAASGYLQARLRFCAGFGSMGVFNFGEVGPTERLANEPDRARDRMRAFQIGAASFAIGILAGLSAVVLPV